MPKNYNSALCHMNEKSQNKVNTCVSTQIKTNWMMSFVLIVSLFLTGLSSSAQVSSSLNPTYGYTFSNISATYTSLGTTGTVFQSGTALNTNAVSAAIPLPFVFTFNGIKENRIFISNNGFITFGIAPTATQLTPISTPNGYNGAIAGFACNTVLSTAEFASGEIRYGTKANGDFAVQFQDLGQSTSSEIRMTFQIILKADGKTIQIVYGPGNIGSSISSPCQVGLRGTNPQDFNNRTVASAGSWNTGGTAGTTNAQTAACTSVTVMPNAGRTFQWTPTAYTPTYLTTPLTTTQNFNSWVNGSGANNVPSTNWATNGYGSASWQIDNVNASSAGWPNSSGSYTPADYQGVAFGRSARFNSFNASNSQVGYLDYYVNLSGTTSFLSLDFHTINTSGSDILQVFLSTDGGATFNQIGANITASAVGWRAQKIPMGAITSATSIIRFKGTADNGNTDIGIDNVRINNCVPAGNTFSNPINVGPMTASVNYGGNNLSENCYTDSFNSTSTPGSPLAGPANDVFYKFQITECGSSLAIGACLTEFFSYIYLLDASGNILDSDYGCDDNQPFNPTLVNLFLPIGTYYVVVSGLNVSDTGNIGLSFTYTPGAGTPPAPTIACYETATFNNATCAWVVTGTQPAMPTLACYQTATFNNTTCAWVVTGTQPTTQVPNTIISEGFENFSSLATNGWSAINTSTPAGAGTWGQGTSDWVAQSGASTSWAKVDYTSVLGNNTISNWLIAPQRLLKNGDVITFWTRTATPVSFPDRLQVRLSTTGAGTNPNSPTSVGSYTTLLADINPTLTTTGYPTTFTKYTLTVSGLAAPANCRVAFRYFVTGGGPSGANSNTIGIDTFSITRALPPLACYESYVFNGTTCQYDVTGTQPAMPLLACYQTASFNTNTCTWNVSGTQPVMPTLACYQTATFNNTTCSWVVTGTQPEMPTLACYETATFNNTTCVWDVTGTQPITPSLVCYETATFNNTTCVWDVTGTQPMIPSLACYETATFNNTTCVWDVTGTQPIMPTLACYETATFNGETCVWDITGAQPVIPTLACYETATFNSETCVWDVTGTQPMIPSLACYETATFNSETCVWDVTGMQPMMPTLACYEIATFNSETCIWDVTGTQPIMPTLECYETATFNSETCVWDVTGMEPIMPTLACYETATFNNTTCVWDVTGSQPMMPALACYETASFNSETCIWDVTGTQPIMPTLACYETATFNSETCVWDVTGMQPVIPTLACYETATFNNTTCIWDITGTEPTMPTLACYETATFNSETCIWDVTGTEPIMPTLACYETATFNNTTCVWDVTGSQPMMPALACYETASFNSETCIWDVTGSQPMMPALACYETASFNSETCIWDVTGTQPMMPTLACYETATFNSEMCTWDVTGIQPDAPTGLTCYQTAIFNNTMCSWDVSGTQPAMPTLLCYQTASFNNTTCIWNVTGTQPAMPTLLCYQTATFNNTTCAWDVTGTQPTLGSLTITSAGSYTWSGPYGNGITYTTSGVYTSVVGCNIATLNLTITVNTFSLGSSCGATISGLAVTITTPLVSGVTTYTFRITNMVTSTSFIVNRPVNSFALSNYPGVTLGTPYKVEVSTNGGATYGSECFVNTPSPTATIGTQCGTVLSSMTQFVYCNSFSGISGYRFRITNLTTNAVQIYNNSLNRFQFSAITPTSFVTFGTNYFVEVAIRNTDGTYLPYSNGCNVTTRAFPTSQLVATQCNYIAISNTQNISVVSVPSATGYRIELTNASQSYSFAIDRTVTNFNLNMFPGLLTSTTYSVRVAVRIGGVWGPLTGTACNLTTPGVTRIDATSVSNIFSIVASPNPFVENFMFNVKTSSESTLEVRVYDMLGKLIENRKIEVSEIENLEVGSNYPSGIYNVIVSQDKNTQTLRIIKR